MLEQKCSQNVHPDFLVRKSPITCLNDAVCRKKCRIIFGYVYTGVCGDVVIVTHNTTISLTCTTSGLRTPDWFLNGTEVDTTGDRYRVSTRNGVSKTITLTINGNLTCETVNVYCELITTERQFVHIHNTTLRFQGCCILLFC